MHSCQLCLNRFILSDAKWRHLTFFGLQFFPDINSVRKLYNHVQNLILNNSVEIQDYIRVRFICRLKKTILGLRFKRNHIGYQGGYSTLLVLQFKNKGTATCDRGFDDEHNGTIYQYYQCSLLHSYYKW